MVKKSDRRIEDSVKTVWDSSVDSSTTRRWFENSNLIDWSVAYSLACMSPMLYVQTLSLWQKPHFQFFPIAWMAFVYFWCIRIRTTSTTESIKRLAGGFGLYVLSLAIALLAILISSPWMVQVAAVGIVASWLLIRAGHVRWTSALGLISFLVLTIPLPAGLDGELIQLLQAKSSQAASYILDLFRIRHLPEGNVLSIAQKKLFVDEACSGVDSLYALMAVCLFILTCFRQRMIVAVLSLALVPVWASCSNILRLVVIVVGIDQFHVDLSSGSSHTILGLVVFALAFLCDYSFIMFLSAAFEGKENEPEENESSFADLCKVHKCGAIARVFCLIFFVFSTFVAIQGSRVLANRSLYQFPGFSQEGLALLRKEQVLPETLNNWRLDSFDVVERSKESVFGQYSHTWSYRTAVGPAQVSVDFPFRGFHLLEICYQSSGWRKTEDSKVIQVSPEGADGLSEEFTIHVASLVNDDGTFSYLAYSLFQLDGTPIVSHSRGIRGFQRFEQTVFDPISFQVQINLQTKQPPSEEDKMQLLENLKFAISKFRLSFSKLAIEG